MLQIKNVRKEYRTGTLVQTALDDVCLALRESEFVAVLGPSGSGKTTLLNLIGGLDRYDSGDLIINGVSTKKYMDRDWDSYRNHTIGFVFQSYNLIPHQSVLANVELALTISGVSRSEKRKRATEALEKVGLGDQLHKKPNQMSGGQMQRVAIARALVNDPDILLADEPTGALDTHTSIQIMELLKEVAKDRLVVMVTHNPELANEYATRIVQLRDGRIICDSDPFDPEVETEAVHKNLGHASMSFFTALALSFNNLWTKRGRTILTAFAGSIGIIGIALILSLSNGVDAYIKNIEEETLSEYPLMIESSGVDFSGMFMQMEQAGSSSDDKEKEEEQANVEAKERRIAMNMFSGIKSNDLASFKKYLDENSKEVMENAVAVEYSYPVSPQIYRLDDKVGYRQIHPDQTLSKMGVSYGGFSSYMMMNGDCFFALPEKDELYRDQYEIKAGRWPEKYNELVLVLPPSGSVSDTTLYSLGLKDMSELDDMIDRYMRGETVQTPDGPVATYTYEDFMGLEFKLVDITGTYEYDSTYGVYVDRSQNQDYMLQLVKDSEPITIVGVVKPAEGAKATMLSYGVCYHHDLIGYVMDQSENSDIVKAQKADRTVNVFTGKAFGEEESEPFDMSSLFTLDGDAMAGAFHIDQSALNMDLSDLGDLDFSKVNIDFSQVDLSGLQDVDMTPAVEDFMNSEIGQKIASGDPGYTVDQEELRKQISSSMGLVSEQVQPIIQAQIDKILQSVMDQLMDQVEEKLEKSMGQFAGNLRNAVWVDTDAFAGAIQFNMEGSELSELMMSMAQDSKESYEGNLRKFNSADEDQPSSILIYPKDFESKGRLSALIDTYNAEVREAGLDDKVITYTDYVATLMSSVTTIVNTISYVLVAFVAISLIVSSIMIGIITYISVLERTKEIGILRAIGASKRNIAQVFNAETFIVGLMAGILGVAVALLILIPGNAVIHSLTGNPDVSAVLPAFGGLALVIISVVLTVIGGLIPSGKAARKDPVAALRSE
ncbi:MAG: ABC transporter ATP-binding protein/permease [Firmicutes bacterium]|nr:ABC transporter ATP-binding protein/permease [Bacillota bacterium]